MSISKNRSHAPKPRLVPTFVEESEPKPSRLVLRHVAFDFLSGFAPHSGRSLHKAVANEATRRVMGQRLDSQAPAEGELLTNHHPAQPHPAEQAFQEHAKLIGNELAWLQERRRVSPADSCRRFDRDPLFRSWLARVPMALLTEWGGRYLAEQPPPKRLRHLLETLSKLVPMPETIRKTHFTSVSPWQPRYGAWVEYLIATASQRLVAVHTARHAVDGPQALAMLLARCRSQNQRCGAIASPGFAKRAHLSLVESEAAVGSALSETALTAASKQLWELMEPTVLRLGTPEGIQEELELLRPTMLRLERPCIFCRHSGATSLRNRRLPPFHLACRCLQLGWVTPGVTAYDRRIRLWTCAAFFGSYPEKNVPLREFIENTT